MSDERCWAFPLGGCGGPITAEHVVTEALFGNQVRVEGASWLGPNRNSIETPIRRLTANILCRDHNNELGRTADRAAYRLLGHFKGRNRPMELRGSRVLRPQVDRRISGVNFAHWLCKTHCNFMIVNGKVPNPLYTQYAFVRPIPRPIYFFFAGALGDSLRLADGRDPVVRWGNLITDDEPSFDAFSISLAGFETIVSPRQVQRNSKDMIDRLHVFEQPTALGVFRIVFDWSGEPPVTGD